MWFLLKQNKICFYLE